VGESNTKIMSKQKHISIKTTKDTQTLKEDLQEMARQAGQRFNDFMNKLLTRCVEDSKNEDVK